MARTLCSFSVLPCDIFSFLLQLDITRTHTPSKKMELSSSCLSRFFGHRQRIACLAILFMVGSFSMYMFEQRRLMNYSRAPDLQWIQRVLSTPSILIRNDSDADPLRNDNSLECREMLSTYETNRKQIPFGSTFCQNSFMILRRCVNSDEVGSYSQLPNYFLRGNNSNETVNDEEYVKAHIAFVHLPKSGGTSVERFLLSSIGASYLNYAITHCNNFAVGARALATNLDSPMFFYSKRSYGLHNFNQSSRKFAYITWFRHPVDRFVSAYYYIKRSKVNFHRFYDQFILTTSNLAESLVKSRETQVQEFDNYLVRLLQFGSFPEIDESFEDCCGCTMNVPVIEEKHYLVAKDNLNKMAFIGLLDEFKLSQDMLGYILGKPRLSDGVQINTNPHKTIITDFERSEIERRNYWDLKLYKEAVSIFSKQKQQYLMKAQL
ncbi:uncharacterized protein LOC144357295 [Saccoglossus kowalevskii]